MSDKSKPNIIFVLADPLRECSLGYMHEEDVITPNFDKFARQTSYSKTSVSPFPVCTPYRGSLLTGRAPASTGFVLNDIPLSWRSVTAGHHVGILAEVDAPDDARISFITGPAAFDFRLDQVRNEDLHIDAGGEGQAVSVSTLHSQGDITHAEFDFVEEDIKPGNHAYYVRVLQADFHRAWSSPIYVDLLG